MGKKSICFHVCCFCFIFHFVVIDVHVFLSEVKSSRRHVFLMFSYVWFMFIRSNMFWFDYNDDFTLCVVSCCCFFTCSSWLFDFPSCVPHFFLLSARRIHTAMFLIVPGNSFSLTHTNPYLANLQKTEEGVSRSVASAARRVTLPIANESLFTHVLCQTIPSDPFDVFCQVTVSKEVTYQFSQRGHLGGKHRGHLGHKEVT